MAVKRKLQSVSSYRSHGFDRRRLRHLCAHLTRNGDCNAYLREFLYLAKIKEFAKDVSEAVTPET